ncbi:MAG TPA: hypothetical protein VK766_05195 [Cytophagaceae bacterium]|jgi:hypothetical protein|nr:hypothetical protein [Cytophagaceae bacterium]
MKNLFDPTVKNEILSRIDKLEANTKAQWGKMNVTQGLRHMSMAFEIASGKLDPTPSKIPPMPKWLLKFFLINVKPPKEQAETFKELNTVTNGIQPTDFEAERSNLKKMVEDFFNSTHLISENKIAGKFHKNDWGKLNYNHTDHHLRQFGV